MIVMKKANKTDTAVLKKEFNISGSADIFYIYDNKYVAALTFSDNEIFDFYIGRSQTDTGFYLTNLLKAVLNCIDLAGFDKAVCKNTALIEALNKSDFTRDNGVFTLDLKDYFSKKNCEKL